MFYWFFLILFFYFYKICIYFFNFWQLNLYIYYLMTKSFFVMFKFYFHISLVSHIHCTISVNYVFLLLLLLFFFFLCLWTKVPYTCALIYLIIVLFLMYFLCIILLLWNWVNVKQLKNQICFVNNKYLLKSHDIVFDTFFWSTSFICKKKGIHLFIRIILLNWKLIHNKIRKNYFCNLIVFVPKLWISYFLKINFISDLNRLLCI